MHQDSFRGNRPNVKCLWLCMVGRKLSEERVSTEEQAMEVEKKLSDLISRINNMIRVDIADTPATYSAEQTLNAVSLFTLNY